MRNSQKILILLIIGVFCLSHDLVAQDSVRVARSERHAFRPEPLKATMLAVAFPGLGQIYNRKYWKIPLVYAGFAALFYSVSYNSSSYNTMMKAYQDFTDKIPATDSYIPLIKLLPSEYDPVLFPNTYDPSTASWVSTNLLKSVDYFKKYRDLSYIGIAAWYLVTILDANVDASLFDFDVNKNLNLTLYPMNTPLPGGIGAGLGVSLIYTF
ncbi:MAG: DUF5683 domain-containing protein [Bacteroidales bacterium]